ncbi:2OG-Fe(II) oxygenase [Terricaulis sp.]|uniref:2OG-Fe(II) oxygenase n=1 Tax=Terricaulis sp. TaxID=2768686 RepID=UPI002AC509B5|nr:2OG-Fe(II) oxygenase [Terricaulis sp.]MDZ4691246.1 2OG-Fe(II) oxygenase [Terricaulis sp.]
MTVTIESLKDAAASGDPRSQFRYARELLIGTRVRYDSETALRLVEAACSARYPQALLFHATLAALGFGRSQSFEDALGFVEQAAALGDARAQGQLAALGGREGFRAENWLALPSLQKHHDAPRIFTVESFLSRDACAWLIDQTRRRLIPAKVKDPAQGGSGFANYRSNSGAGFSSIESDLVVQMTNLRIATVMNLPIANQEPTNVLHYAPGQEYRPHFDFVTPDEAPAFQRELASVGQRVATVLIYLNDDYEGGETHFPRLNFRYRGATGDALIFWNLSATGQLERQSLHAGVPVVAGEKWILSKWIRERPFPLV